MLEARVGDDRVQRAEALARGVHRGAVALARGQVGGEGLPGPVRIGLDVDGEHLGSILDEAGGDRSADPARRARHQRAARAHGRGLLPAVPGGVCWGKREIRAAGAGGPYEAPGAAA